MPSIEQRAVEPSATNNAETVPVDFTSVAEQPPLHAEGGYTERPRAPRQSSKFKGFRRGGVPNYKSIFHTNQSSVFSRLSQRAHSNLKSWYSRGHRHKTEFEYRQELEKSRLLFCESYVGTPMVMAFASSFLPNDGERRVPVLFEQISIKVRPAEFEGVSKNTVTVELEYGSGPSMIRWFIVRGYREFLWLHGHLVKHKVWHRNAPKPPHLPRPHKYKNENAEEGGDGAASISSGSSAETFHPPTYDAAVEHYLERLLHMFRFRVDSNRLLAFLELSHMSIKLAPEYSFHGKEGNVLVRSRASEQGWRVRHWQPQDVPSMIQRHTYKWMLVRDSFIIIVENIASTGILDVFLVDPWFKISGIDGEQGDSSSGSGRLDPTNDGPEGMAPAKGFFLTLKNNSRWLKVATRGERDLARWQDSISKMVKRTPWSHHHRFDSFAPVRHNVFGQWFVDARDYFWILSDALDNARDTIFILDWWLSPELYLRRPAEGNQEWRLDRVLKRKAEQGVKIFVVVYRNVGATIPIDSQWTKHSLLDLHPNVHVMRSPNQFLQKSAMFWAHHEKLCVIDSMVAFNGGIDLCYGRWDTPQHVLADDARHPFYKNNAEALRHPFKTQSWVGKDYSNPRVKDFFELDKPYDDMYDRQVCPRMPWHDVHQMVVGRPARDLARHFVQRWNYVIRQKLPSREMPLLLPPPDFTDEELERLNLTGTCEYQVLRSSGNWSLGLQKHEQSIQNAYLKLIDSSEHLVYIENQFFITSTEVDGVLIENQIGTALVQRIIRAHERNEKWRAIIVIPLMPGFEAEVDSTEASSVRVICQCQFNSISRGTNSIFYRLERAGIHPENYISFFSLRKWGKMGPKKLLVTEQLYIHAKTMVVDDRVAIIGSANINERSMRGVRDSEVAVCVRDTAPIESRLAGKPWKAAKFAYTLRLRLMREHLGVDIDKMDVIEQQVERLQQAASGHAVPSQNDILREDVDDRFPYWLFPELHSFNYCAGTELNRGLRDHKKISTDRRVQGNEAHEADVKGYGIDQLIERLKVVDKLNMCRAPVSQDLEDDGEKLLCKLLNESTFESLAQFKLEFYQSWTGTGSSSSKNRDVYALPTIDEEGNVTNNEPIPVDPWVFDDPVSDKFYLGKWLAIAERNTMIFRLVFRCQPDNDVQSWKDYKKYSAHYEAFMRKQMEQGGPGTSQTSPSRVDVHGLETVGQPTSATLSAGVNGVGNERSVGNASESNGLPSNTSSSDDVSFNSAAHFFEKPTSSTAAGVPGIPSLDQVLGREQAFDPKDSRYPEEREHSRQQNSPTRPSEDGPNGSAKVDISNIREPRLTTDEEHMEDHSHSIGGSKVLSTVRPWLHFEQVYSAKTAEEVLNAVTGNLVVFPTEWLSKELDSGNWNFQMDRMTPLEIYD